MFTFGRTIMGVIGEGAKGRVIDAVAPRREHIRSTSAPSIRRRTPSASSALTDPNTFEHIVRNATRVVLHALYDEAMDMVLEGGDAIQELLKSMRTTMTAKQFMGTSAKTSFQRERDVYRGLSSIYGKQAVQEFTALQAITYKKKQYIGAEVSTSSRGPIFFIFNAKCHTTLESMPSMDAPTLKKILFDVLSSINMLQANDSGHFDIKPDNIMFCGSSGRRHFKLIDWDLSHSFTTYTDRFYASRSFTSPIAWLVSPNTLYANVMMQYGTSLLARSRYKQVFKHPALQTFVKDAVIPYYQQLMKMYKTKEALFQKYKYTIDLYNLALTILFLAVKHDLLQDAADVVAFAHRMALAQYEDAALALQAAMKVLTP
jgi:serine/threonine protein kinase